MEYNDFQVMNPESFNQIAKEYLSSKEKQNKKYSEIKLEIKNQLETLNNTYSYLSQKGLNQKRKQMFKQLSNVTIAQISSMTEPSNPEKQTKKKNNKNIIYPVSFRKIIKKELTLIETILKTNSKKLNIIAKERISTIKNLRKFVFIK